MKIQVFDIGGTNIKYSTYDSLTHTLGPIYRVPTPPAAAEIFTRVARLIHLPYVGISTFGTILHNRVVAPNHTFPDYQGCQIDALINSHLSHPVRVYADNDLKSAAAGLLTSAPAPAIQVVVGLGTGIGSAILLHGKILRGANNGAGEGGGMPFPPSTWEQQASVSTLIHNYRAHFPHDISAEKILALASSPTAPSITRMIVDNWYTLLAQGLLNYIYLLNPEKIILCGAIAQSKNFDPSIIKAKMLSFNPKPRISVENCQLEACPIGNAAQLIGIGSLAADYFFPKNKTKTKKKSPKDPYNKYDKNKRIKKYETIHHWITK